MKTPNANASNKEAAKGDFQHDDEDEAATNQVSLEQSAKEKLSKYEGTEAALDGDEAPSENINGQDNAAHDRLQHPSQVGSAVGQATLQVPFVAPLEAASTSGTCQFIESQRIESVYQGPPQAPLQAAQMNQASQYTGSQMTNQPYYQMPFQALPPGAQIHPTHHYIATNSSRIQAGVPGRMGPVEAGRNVPEQLQERQPQSIHGNMAGQPSYQMMHLPPPQVQPAMNSGQAAMQMGRMNEMAETNNVAQGNGQNGNMIPMIGQMQYNAADNIDVIQRLESLNEEIAECEEQLIILNRLRTLMRRRGG